MGCSSSESLHSHPAAHLTPGSAPGGYDARSEFPLTAWEGCPCSRRKEGRTGAEESPVWVEGKVDVCCVEGCVHTLFAGPSSAGLPGIWKERSGKSTPWSEWYIWKI